MKVIDLLNKIANGEEVPKKIAINNTIFIYDEPHLYLQDYYVKEEDNDATWEIWAYALDDEVEIREEDKEIESLINCVNGVLNGQMSSYYEKTDLQVIVEHNFKVIQDKINEIINCLNKE